MPLFQQILPSKVYMEILTHCAIASENWMQQQANLYLRIEFDSLASTAPERFNSSKCLSEP